VEEDLCYRINLLLGQLPSLPCQSPEGNDKEKSVEETWISLMQSLPSRAVQFDKHPPKLTHLSHSINLSSLLKHW